MVTEEVLLVLQVFQGSLGGGPIALSVPVDSPVPEEV